MESKPISAFIQNLRDISDSSETAKVGYFKQLQIQHEKYGYHPLRETFLRCMDRENQLKDDDPRSVKSLCLEKAKKGKRILTISSSLDTTEGRQNLAQLKGLKEMVSAIRKFCNKYADIDREGRLTNDISICKQCLKQFAFNCADDLGVPFHMDTGCSIPLKQLSDCGVMLEIESKPHHAFDLTIWW
jgi:hypothetical protein